jgi:sensor histidine kinase YesM
MMKNLKSGLKLCLIIALSITIVLSAINFKTLTVIEFINNFVVSFLYSITISLGTGLINNYLDKKWDWLDDTNKRVTYGVIFSLLYTIPAVIFCNYLIFMVLNNNKNLFSERMIWIHLFYIILSLGISALLHAKSFIKFWKESSKKEIVKHQVIASDSSAKFETLKNQIDPHFLFNSLNVLSALIEEKPENAVNFTNSLSKIYRYILEEKDKELISLQEELDFAITYMKLLKMRFENTIIFNISEIENSDKMYVVPLSLQLLLENTVKHNFASATSPLTIYISKENDFLFISNNLQKKEVATSNGVGIKNIVSRYGLLTNKKVEIIESTTTFTVKIPILTQKINIMQQKNTEEVIYLKAQRRVKDLKEFYGNLFSYCLVIPCLIVINLLTYSKFLWFFFPMFGWGIGLAIHGFNAFGYGKDWEEKKIEEYMRKNG